MFQRANISLFREAGSLLLDFSYSLGGIIDGNENEKKHFWLFSAFGRFLKKKMQKNAIFPYFRPTVQLWRNRIVGSRGAVENSIQDFCALELYFTWIFFF